MDVITEGHPSPPIAVLQAKEERKNIAITYTNTCSVGNKWHELRIITENSDIIALTETWLRPDTAIESFCPPGLCIYRTDRQDGRTGGGALLLIAQQYQQSQGPSLTTPNIQMASSIISVKGHTVFIACVYRSPNSSVSEDKQLMTILATTESRTSKLLIVGDFNAPEVDWSLESAPSNSFGESLLKLIRDNSLIQHVDEATRWRANQKANILDLILTKYINAINNLPLQVGTIIVL